MIIAKDITQNTPEWDAVRTGIPTASGFDKLVTTTGDPSKQRLKYVYTLAAEKVTGYKEETYYNAVMKRGIMMEEEARAMYELITGQEVATVGFCYHDKDKLFGCSPDGLVGKDGALEVKCPLSHTHVRYLLAGKIPTDYIQQIQGQLFVTGRKWVDFFSHYPGIKPLLIRVKRDEKFISKLSTELSIFCKELTEVTEKLRGA